MNEILPLVAPPTAAEAASVSVVVTTYNHARYLAEAIESILAQTRPADEIIVVDDGSTDAPAAVVAGFAGVRLIRQPNQGLASARNTGLGAARSRFIVFLDADDRLLPRALELGLATFARAAPGTAFVYGGYRMIDEAGKPIGRETHHGFAGSAFEALLRVNFIGMHATALFDRALLASEGGYDPALRRAEDYEMFLRLARRHAIADYPDPVAEYRLHPGTLSTDWRAMLAAVLGVLDCHAAGSVGSAAKAARHGRRLWRRYYGEQALADAGRALMKRQFEAAGLALLFALRNAPRAMLGRVRRRIKRAIGRRLPPPFKTAIKRRMGKAPPAPGRWRWGDFKRGLPASLEFGYDRGSPIDRYYIEGFLSRNAADIAGNVLEIGDDAYSRRFGGDRIGRQDVLHVTPGNPQATIVGDLADPATLRGHSFDCIVLTQTLHLIYDMRAALQALHGALAPGGVLLATVPGITPIDRGAWGGRWCWSLTENAARQLFGEVFGPDAVLTETRGNFTAAVGFLAGLSEKEIPRSRLDPVDPAFPLVIAVRARKPWA